MSFMYPRRADVNAQMEEAHRMEREVEAKAELYAQLHADDEQRTNSVRGVRHVLRRLRGAIRRHG